MSTVLLQTLMIFLVKLSKNFQVVGCKFALCLFFYQKPCRNLNVLGGPADVFLAPI